MAAPAPAAESSSGQESEAEPPPSGDREPTFTEILGVVPSSSAEDVLTVDARHEPEPEHAVPSAEVPAAWSLSGSGEVPLLDVEPSPGVESSSDVERSSDDVEDDDEGLDDAAEVTTATALFAPPRSARDEALDEARDAADAPAVATPVLPGVSMSTTAAPEGERPRREVGGAGVFVPQTRPVDEKPATTPRGPGLADWVRGHRTLAAVGAGLVIVLLLVALFFISRSLFASTDDLGSDPSVAAEPTGTRTVTAAPAAPAAEVVPTGPLAAGTHSYTDLQGGECFSSFESAWQQDYEVSDCAQPHVAQLTRLGSLDGDASAAYPGTDVLQSQMNLLCTGSDALDRQAAAAYPDVQLLASFPADADAWAAGDRTYSCFVNRSGGEALTTSLVAVAG